MEFSLKLHAINLTWFIAHQFVNNVFIFGTICQSTRLQVLVYKWLNNSTCMLIVDFDCFPCNDTLD